MSDLKAAAQQALEALEIGYESARVEAAQYHAAMAGYRPERHAAMDADVEKIAKAITTLKAALAQPLPDPADEYRKGFIDGQIDMRDRPDEQAEKAPHTIIKLPPLPEPNWNERVYGGHGNEITHRWFTDHQMREYARQAVCESEDAWQSRATAPPRREWQGLTNPDIARVFRAVYGGARFGPSEKEFAIAVEGGLKEKNSF
jgi:hypothetical protein